jgi:hypothetical protein
MGEFSAEALATAREPPEVLRFYRSTLTRLLDADVKFMVGGGYAFRHFTGIERWTKDLDVFVRPRDARATLEILAPTGTHTEMLFPHWLGKVHCRGAFIDVVFGSGNGMVEVDDEWFRHAHTGPVLGFTVPICPPEETLWSKAFVAERERYDGADIAHLILACGQTLDWSRLLRRFGDDWRVLLSHLVLFGYVYPGRRDQVPAWVMSTLMRRLSGELGGFGASDPTLCRGTMLSRAQYLTDIWGNGYRDARLQPTGRMSPADVERWTRAITDEPPPRQAPRENRRHR